MKINHGYSQTNTIFEHTLEARLYQDGKPEMVANKCRVPDQPHIMAGYAVIRAGAGNFYRMRGGGRADDRAHD